MPDIAMCKGTGCQLKENCYRAMATPSYYQSYFTTPPNIGGECEYYWPLKNEDERQKHTENGDQETNA